jgi:hypothetical protein
MTSYPVPALPIGKAVERLLVPGARESCSALVGSGPFIIDVDNDETVPDDRLAAALAVLASLPTPTIAQGVADAGTTAMIVSDRCDVRCDGPEGTDLVIEIVESHPIAATAFVELLRHSEGLSVHEAMIAESFVYSMLQAGDEFARWLVRHDSAPLPEYSDPAVLVSRVGDRLLLELNRPDRANAYSAAMRDALCEGLAVALADSSLVVELRGRGDHFSAGGDLDEFGTTPDPATAHAIRSTRHAGRSIAAISNRVTVFVQGACVGAGIELPAFAGRIVAHTDAYFQLPELAMGLVPGAGGTASIAHRIGRQRTAWMGLTRRRVATAQALRWGLIDEVA